MTIATQSLNCTSFCSLPLVSIKNRQCFCSRLLPIFLCIRPFLFFFWLLLFPPDPDFLESTIFHHCVLLRGCSSQRTWLLGICLLSVIVCLKETKKEREGHIIAGHRNRTAPSSCSSRTSYLLYFLSRKRKHGTFVLCWILLRTSVLDALELPVWLLGLLFVLALSLVCFSPQKCRSLDLQSSPAHRHFWTSALSG